MAYKIIIIWFISVIIFNKFTMATDEIDSFKSSPEGSLSNIGKSKYIKSNNYMVVTADHRATKSAIRILELGGTAIDAAISAQMVLNLVEPQSSGIGGGGFILYYDAKTKNIYAWDGREKAPMNFSERVFLNSDGKKKGFIEAVSGGLAVGVPSLVTMLEKAHEVHGNMQWKLLFEDSIKLSTEGFVVGKRLSKLTSRAPHLKNQETAREYFNIDNGGLLEGTLKKNLKFADTLKLIRDNGSKVMLAGELADNILSTVTEHKSSPGLMTKKDFSFVKPALTKPTCGKYRKWKICGMGPPSSGGITILQILGILNNFELSSNNPNDPEVWHLFLEASKLAYTDRGYYIADDDFIDVPIELMLDEKYLKERSELIKKNSIISNPQKGKFNNDSTKYLGIDSTSEKPSTTHLSIIDKYGNALALTSSIEFMFGSGLMTSGFLLNNQMTDFSFYPKDKKGNLIANRPEGKKKPRSSMSPTLIFDTEGELRMILGSPGGSQIICYVAASLVRVIDLNIKPENITEQPNICNRGFKSDIESGVIGDILTKELENKGHKINRKNMTSGIHMIYKDNAKKLYGIADQRREGTAYGL
ncbi:MAG: gamma-glutamyltransferase [Alphaproteobacteria bacterium]|nr:gamma-glutamyltransferase [Alphaproteobacteria bacterium]